MCEENIIRVSSVRFSVGGRLMKKLGVLLKLGIACGITMAAEAIGSAIKAASAALSSIVILKPFGWLLSIVAAPFTLLGKLKMICLVLFAILAFCVFVLPLLKKVLAKLKNLKRKKKALAVEDDLLERSMQEVQRASEVNDEMQKIDL